MLRPSEDAVTGFIRHLHAAAKPEILEGMLASSTMRESYGAAIAVAYARDYQPQLPSHLEMAMQATTQLAARGPLMQYAHQLASLAAGLRNADVAGGRHVARECLDIPIPPMEHYLDFASEFLAGAYERARRDFPTTIQGS